MKTIYRILGGLLIIYFGVVAVGYLQYLFDKGDLKKASQFIYQFKPNPQSGKTLIELMAQDQKTISDKIHCESEITSRTEGIVLIDCAAQDQKVHFEWLINLVSYQVTPNNTYARNLLTKQETPHETK